MGRIELHPELEYIELLPSLHAFGASTSLSLSLSTFVRELICSALFRD
jgi:hypothetical protein